MKDSPPEPRGRDWKSRFANHRNQTGQGPSRIPHRTFCLGSHTCPVVTRPTLLLSVILSVPVLRGLSFQAGIAGRSISQLAPATSLPHAAREQEERIWSLSSPLFPLWSWGPININPLPTFTFLALYRVLQTAQPPASLWKEQAGM